MDITRTKVESDQLGRLEISYEKQGDRGEPSRVRGAPGTDRQGPERLQTRVLKCEDPRHPESNV